MTARSLPIAQRTRPETRTIGTTLLIAAALVSRASRARGADLVEPSVARSVSNVLLEKLVVEEYTYATTTPSVFSFKTRGYFGATTDASTAADQTLSDLKIGPTLKFAAGDRVNILLDNKLEPNTDSVVMNTYHTPGTTNLHMHGLHISAYDPHDNVLIKVEPGSTRQYAYDIIADHAAGTHWYHAHAHGSTALQVGGGLVGVIIVEDGSDEIPAEYQNLDEKVMMIQYMQFEDVRRIAATSGMGESHTSSSTASIADMFTTNGQYAPTIKIDQNEWTRLRMVFMALDKVVEFTLGSAAAGLGCEWTLLAKDGIYVDNAPRALTNVYMAPGNRADVLIRCTTVGSFTVDSVGDASGRGPPSKNIATTVGALNFQVVSSVSSATTLTPFNAKLPNYLASVTAYAGSGAVESHTLQFAPVAGGGCNVNYDNAGAAAYTAVSLGNIPAGSVQTWSLSGSDRHPFHIHVNPFQLGSVTDTSGLANPYFFMGDWHDVMYVPSGYSIPQVHFHTADFTGKVVAHCHFLNHEDQGCMGFWEITGDNGTVVSDLASRAMTTVVSPPPSTSSSGTAMTTVVSPPPSTSSSGTVHVASVARAFALCALATLFAYA